MRWRTVHVVWMDAHADAHGWTEIAELERIRLIDTVGVLIPVQDGGAPGHLTLAQSVDEDAEMVDSVLHIPIGMVRQVTDLTAGLTLPLEPHE